MGEMLTIAGVQMDVKIGDVQHNIQQVLSRIAEAADLGASLVVFPECCLTGYCFESLDEALPIALPTDAPALSTLFDACRRFQVDLVIGYLERDGDQIFNAASLLTADGAAAHYRKAHLPHLGVDRFVTPGDTGFVIGACRNVRIGLNICYDTSFPETARALALQGADLIALPTNWPPGARLSAELVPPVRAMENHVYFIAVNRVGHERGFDFIGHSQICAPGGAVLASAAHDRPCIVTAQIDVARAREKRVVLVPARHELDRFRDRRPDLYSILVRANDL